MLTKFHKKKIADEYLKKLAVVMLIVACAIILAFSIYRSLIMFSLDYNEGWNAYHALEVVNNINLYGNDYTPVNYPPLYYYFLNFADLLVNDYFLSGRLLSIFSLIFIASIVGLIVKIRTGNKYYAVISFLTLISLWGVVSLGYIGMFDPQIFAHAIQMVGLLMFIKKKDQQSGFLFSLSLFIKHNIIALPISLVIFMLLRHRKRISKWLISSAITFILFTIVSITYSNGNFINQLTIGREYSLSFLKGLLIEVGPKISLMLLLSGFLAAANLSNLKKNDFLLPAIYLCVSLFSGIIFSGGSGTDVNMFFGLIIAISWFVGVGFHYIKDNAKVAFVVLLMALYLLVGSILRVFRSNIVEFNILQENTRKDIIYLNQFSDPVLCDTIALCYWAGREFAYDPFLLGEKMITGVLAEKEIIGLLEDGYFSAIQIEGYHKTQIYKDKEYKNNIVRVGRYTENFLIGVAKNYELKYSSLNGDFYIKK